MIKILLAGTPNFSVPIFEEIIKNFNVVGIITQSDKKSGRGLNMVASPVKELAIKYNIKFFQEDKIGNIFDELKVLDFDIFLTCAFGQLIPENILALAKKGSVNIHGSLLPKYRGAAPIQHALLNGDKKTGISLIYMIKQMDAGNIIFEEEVKIEDNDTSDSMFDKLSLVAKNKITEWLKLFYNGEFIEKEQDINKVTFAPKLTKEEAFLNIDTSEKMINKIRAYNSNPGAYLFINNKRVKIFSANTKEGNDYLKIKSKDGFIYSNKYQFEGKKIVDIK
ncbi:MAG: methionyl-tRNA formyltransferase [Metamycoplasmataceae bacterium]